MALMYLLFELERDQWLISTNNQFEVIRLASTKKCYTVYRHRKQIECVRLYLGLNAYNHFVI